MLFSYGSLLNKNVQIANFGRGLTGREDALPAYARRMVPIIDPKLMASSGESHHANVEPTSNPQDAASGIVFEITEQELAAADIYEEVAEYRRISVTLKSGDQASVYLECGLSLAHHLHQGPVTRSGKGEKPEQNGAINSGLSHYIQVVTAISRDCLLDRLDPLPPLTVVFIQVPFRSER